MNTDFMVILIGFIIGIFLHKAFLKRKQKSSHLWRQKSAEKIHNSIKSIKHNGQIISYLRKVEPFVFEELLLIAVAQNPKCKVIKNDRYTGDGGIDGKFILNNRLYIIQAKRYKSHIDSKDILDFIKKINESKAYKGLFIHTGKTGSQSWEFSSIDDNIEIISGNKLVHLMQFGYANTH